jgi:hypothetical protein
MRRFGITFDVQGLDRRDTAEQAANYVRRWSDFVGVEIPPDATFAADFVAAGERGPTLRVTFEWDQPRLRIDLAGSALMGAGPTQGRSLGSATRSG